jgi:hypothetical protein
MLWQELFRFGEYVCGRGSGTDEDAWPANVSSVPGRLRSGRVSSVWLPWTAVFEFLHHDQREAPSALILSICETVSRDLEVLVRKPDVLAESSAKGSARASSATRRCVFELAHQKARQNGDREGG